MNYASVKLNDVTFGSLERVPTDTRKLYAAEIKPVIRIQTPPLVLAAPLTPEPGAAVVVTTTPGLHAFLEAVETRVLEAAVENKDTWFPRGIDDDSLKSSFKTFLGPGQLKCRTHDDITVFNADRTPHDGDADVPQGTYVRCVLELSRVSFGRYEYGAVWRVVQAQVMPGCLIADDVESVLDPDEDFL